MTMTTPRKLPNGNSLVFRTTPELRKSLCPICTMPAEGESGATILEMDEAGAIVTPKPWGHRTCMEREWTRMVGALDNAAEWLEDTQRAMVEYLMSHDDAPHGIAVTYNPKGPRATRYRFRALKENEVL